jgi:RNA polymerase sigma-70 factor (ECF subfamily)
MIESPQAPELLPSVARGDLPAFEQLYDQYSPVVYSILLRILGSPEDAQEVLQEAFVKVWNDASMFDASRGSEIAWLISIARSRGIDRIRSRRTRGQREQEAGREISIQSSNVVQPTASQSLILEEERRAVRSALSELPEPQRIALELAYFGGLSQSQIAERLKEPLGTIKTRMQLGMKKLRDRLRPTLNR